MNLFFHTLFTGCSLFALGAYLAWRSAIREHTVKSFPRSKIAAIATMTIAAAWFLYRHILHLSEADFGEHKVLISIITLVLLVMPFKFLPDFLAVRGAAILVLFYSREALDAAFMQEPASRLFMVSIVYVGIAIALYLGAWPYRLRDFLNWLYVSSRRPRILGASMAAYGILLGAIAFGY
ncbi:MAG: hypothetical protein CMI26_00135 [Opitutae bacterium]|nr:hypothetical protein [Opitutae bacterium]|tara:strand:+ start:5722 stop:6261 length:540 start_codon:yes stop_codon:yes gene_type:complete